MKHLLKRLDKILSVVVSSAFSPESCITNLMSIRKRIDERVDDQIQQIKVNERTKCKRGA